MPKPEHREQRGEEQGQCSPTARILPALQSRPQVEESDVKDPQPRSADVPERPAYTVAEAARYLELPAATLQYWVARGRAEPVIRTPEPRFLSFINLVEAHVLSALRRDRMSLQSIRRAVEFLREKFRSEHPLADKTLATDGLDIFVERYGELINASRQGQLAMREVLLSHLRRLERAPSGVVVRLYPFVRRHGPDEPRTVMIDPHVQFGRPVLVGSGIPTAVIAGRFKAGESVQELARDYARNSEDIQEAIRAELHLERAA
jgi:uncharacterized protein (DUF433 family)